MPPHWLTILIQLQALSVCCGQQLQEHAITPCPQFCKCTPTNRSPGEGSARGRGMSADCHGNDTDFATAVDLLPNGTTEFAFTVFTTHHQHQLVDISRPGIARFQNLTVFRIRPQTQDMYYDFGLKVGIDGWAFCELPRLEELHLNVKVFQYQIPSSSWACLSQEHFHTLDLTYTRGLFSESAEAMLSSLPLKSLKRLSLRNIQGYGGVHFMERLNFMLFARPYRSSLEELDFSYNSLRGVNPGLRLMKRLRKLDLSGNHIFGPESIDSLSIMTYLEILWHPSIEVCYLSYQRFSNYKGNPVVSYDGAVGLSERMPTEKNKTTCLNKVGNTRSLMNNGLQFLKCLASLGGINASDVVDKIEVATDAGCLFGLQFVLSRSIKEIYLSGVTTYTFMAPGLWEGKFCLNPNNSLRILDISSNRIGELSELPHQLDNITFTGLPKLQEFNVRDNKMVFYKPTFFRELQSVEVLLLGGNQLMVDSNLFFEDSQNLRDLDLSRNSIVNISQQQFSGLKLLESLDLSGNQLGALDFILPNSTSLKLLNVSGNSLHALTSSFIEMLGSKGPNVSVDMTGNPLICDCSTLDFVQSVQAKDEVVNYIDRTEMICYSPGKTQLPIVKVNLRDLKKTCQSTTVLTVIESVSGTLLAVVILLVVWTLVRKRWKIRYFMYRRLHASEALPIPDDAYEWDGFVIYSSANRYWVLYRLQEEMEEQRGRRLFMYQRDILPNERLVQELGDRISRSRKAILVLTPEFLESDHCLYDALLAHTRLQHEGLDVIVLVKLKNLPIAGIPGMITNLLNSKECLEWTEDEYGQRLFWDKLEHELMTPPQNPMRQ